jgi:hypothetical protein
MPQKKRLYRITMADGSHVLILSNSILGAQLDFQRRSEPTRIKDLPPEERDEACKRERMGIDPYFERWVDWAENPANKWVEVELVGEDSE